MGGCLVCFLHVLGGARAASAVATSLRSGDPSLPHPPLHLSPPCSKAPPLFSFASVAIGAGLGGKKQREEEDELFLPVRK